MFNYSTWNTDFTFRWALESRLLLNAHGLVVVLKPKFNKFYKSVSLSTGDFDIKVLGDLDAFW